MKDILIEEILLDVCSDPRVKNGTVNLSLQEHIDVLIDVLKEHGMSQSDVKFLTNSINEGKYPERQAYNREGFLVTFPNSEYKKQALATGEYSNQDPTHGKGGMHLMKKSDVSDEEPVEKSPSNDIEPPAKKTVSAPSTNTQVKKTATSQPDKTVVRKPDVPTIKSVPQPQQPSPQKSQNGSYVKYTSGIPVDPSTDLKLDKISDYRDPSLEWVHNRKWEKRENNNYYDAEGNLKAITGLDGETVIPVSEEDRTELKTFIEDKKKKKLGIPDFEKPEDSEKN